MQKIIENFQLWQKNVLHYIRRGERQSTNNNDYVLNYVNGY